MSKPLLEEGPGLPEKLVDHLHLHLRRHSLWDALLIFFPPSLAFSYLAIFLYDSTLTVPRAVIFVAAAVFSAAMVGEILRYRSKAPSVRVAARLIDERVEGKDRFVTLATIDPVYGASFLLSRLRHEATGLLHRIDLKRDFPYRLKRSFSNSLMGSVTVLLLFHLFLQLAPLLTPQAPADEALLLAQRLSQMPRLSELARRLEALAVGLKKQALSEKEKHSLIQELLKTVEQLLGDQQQGEDARDLLNQIAESLRELDQGAAEGQEKGSGGLKTNLPEEREGKGKESAKGSGGEGQGKSSALQSKDLQGERSPQKGKEAGKGEGQRDQGRGNRLEKDREQRKETEGMAKSDMEGKGGKSKGDEIPRGTPPTERFMKPGEQGEKGLKDPRFVTVELPELESPEIQGSSGTSGSGKRREFRSKVPISNVPLRPPESPEAASEKQPLPLQYRKLIR